MRKKLSPLSPGRQIPQFSRIRLHIPIFIALRRETGNTDDVLLTHSDSSGHRQPHRGRSNLHISSSFRSCRSGTAALSICMSATSISQPFRLILAGCDRRTAPQTRSSTWQRPLPSRFFLGSTGQRRRKVVTTVQ